MSVDKFGRHHARRNTEILLRRRRAGFKLTPEGDFNIGNKRLRYVNDPIESNDCVTKKYADDLTSQLRKKIEINTTNIIGHNKDSENNIRAANQTINWITDWKTEIEKTFKEIADAQPKAEKRLEKLEQQLDDQHILTLLEPLFTITSQNIGELRKEVDKIKKHLKI